MNQKTDVKHNPGLTYREAGVNIDTGNQLVERIKDVTRATKRPEVIGNIGGFGALCKIPTQYQNPVLVSGTDGVGTKLKLAIDTGYHDGVGIDLVAMCVNDLLVVGAEPLFFLDYYATSALDIDVAESVIKSIAAGCTQAGAALIGGETAEMPGMYQAGDYDLAGFCVGVAEENNIIDGSSINENDVILAIGSSGPHSNGYSLIRKILDVSKTDINSVLENKTLAEHLLTPTRIYIKPVLELIKQFDIHGLAHITGGGLTENLPRVLPDNVQANIDLNSWQLPTIFDWLQTKGNVDENEMLRTFNCGVGMAVILPESHAEKALSALKQAGENAWKLGSIELSNGETNNNQAIRYSGTLG